MGGTKLLGGRTDVFYALQCLRLLRGRCRLLALAASHVHVASVATPVQSSTHCAALRGVARFAHDACGSSAHRAFCTSLHSARLHTCFTHLRPVVRRGYTLALQSASQRLHFFT